MNDKNRTPQKTAQKGDPTLFSPKMDHEDIQIKEGRMCKTYSTYARDEKCIHNFVHRGTL
jgi:hypothetical protein